MASSTARSSQWLDRLIGRTSAQVQPQPGHVPASGQVSVEVAGTFLLDLLIGLGPYRSIMLRAMVKNEIGRVDPERWYDRNRLIASLQEVESAIGPHILFWIGRKTAQQLFQRAESVCESPHDAVSSLDRCFRMAHRINPADAQPACPVGQWQFDRQGVGSARIVIDSPYPQEWLHGLLCGSVRDGDPLVQVQPESGEGHRAASFIVRWDR